jgi:5-oxoprolinase (ATP-hydrolysing) subunit A
MTAHPSATALDLNADVGESFGRWTLGDDEALLPYISSANVACGFHAGDPTTLRTTVNRCVELGVVVGAQVSYPDLAGFGRRAMDVAPHDLESDVLYQLAALDGLCRVAGSRARYLKPHGALYHRTLSDLAQAAAVVAAVVTYDPALAVLTMERGALADAARSRGVRVIREGFADRAYTPDGHLVPRDRPGAVLTDASEVAQQVLRLADSGRFDSLCLHGDTPGAPELAKAARTALQSQGRVVRAFV